MSWLPTQSHDLFKKSWIAQKITKDLTTFCPAEIPNFLDDLECDVMIAMAKQKGMRKNSKATYNEGLTFDDPKSTFKLWDYNSDGFLDPEEVRH